MDEATVRDRVEEFIRVRGNPGLDLVAQVEAALFVEEVFGIALSDSDMCEAHLGSGNAMVSLVMDRTGGARGEGA